MNALELVGATKTSYRDFPRETRKAIDGSQVEVLVVRSPEHWPPASAIRYQYHLDRPNGRIAIPVQALSLQQYEEIESQYHIPEWPHESEQTEEFKTMRKEAIASRRIALIETSVGHKIPGSTVTEKDLWLNEHDSQEVESLEQFIRFWACGFINRSSTSTEILEESSEKVIAFHGFEDWDRSASTKHFFRMDLVGDGFLMEFPLNAISDERRTYIDEHLALPDPPIMNIKDAHGRRSVDKTAPNTNDATWLRSCRAIAQKRTLAWLSACLPFAIPGENDLEKVRWIYDRAAGQVIRLGQFIQVNVARFNGGPDFFEKRISRLS